MDTGSSSGPIPRDPKAKLNKCLFGFVLNK